uniref:Malonyl-CoA-acyl carrier protein transacylase n=1 Tax=Ursus maritimus TaxID=29073 RepID=A0A384D319_URSMA
MGRMRLREVRELSQAKKQIQPSVTRSHALLCVAPWAGEASQGRGRRIQSPGLESQRYHRASPQALTCQESSSSVKGLVQGLSGPLCVLFKPEHQASGSGCLSLWTPGQLSGAEPLTEPLLRPWPHVPRLSPQVIENCVAAAGFSVGEFAALVFAGAMEFSEGLYAVKVRAEAMQEASEAVPSGMLSVLGQPQSKFAFACLEAREHCKTLGIENPVCEVANYLFPDCRVISGHLEALQFLQKNASRYHFRRTRRLPVSGGFHTRLMEPALEPLAHVLKSVNVKKPLVSVHSNVDGNRYAHPKHIPKALVQQVVSPVKWEQTMHAIYERRRGTEFPKTFEVGPGRQLGSILKSCNLQAWKSYRHVDVLEDDGT